VISGLSRPKVIVEKRPSLTLSVRALLAYAKRQRADTIVVGTHARSGIARLLLGSFAETLLLHSTIPVLVVGPHVETSLSTRKRSRILFSTDFGPSAYPTFKKVVALARAQQSVTNPSAKITLFHCLPHPTEPIVRSGVYLLGGGYVSFPDYMTDEEQRKRKLAEEYVKAAKKMGVTVEIGLNPGHDGTAHAIVQEALAENANLIAMAAESGRVSAALIGSVTRQVVRTANCPVWVLRAKGA
jgi:nucleotide-binding universal stress UspA family protein